MAFKWLTKLTGLDSTDSANPDDGALNRALAVLMLEVAQSDFSESTDETEKLRSLLMASSDLDEVGVARLLTEARDDKERSAGLYEFTRLACNNMSMEDRYKLIEQLWQIAFVDGVIDKYEEAAIRKASELMYVPHADFIRAKLAAQQLR